MDTPAKTNSKAWSADENKLLKVLLQNIVDFENDPATEPKNKDETFQWLSSQFSSRGYNRSSTAIKRRTAGRLRFLQSPKNTNTTPVSNGSQSLNENGVTQPVMMAASSRASMSPDSSSDDDIPLSQLRGRRAIRKRGSRTQTDNSPSNIGGARKRESETLQSIKVEPGANLQPLAALPHVHRLDTPPAKFSPSTSSPTKFADTSSTDIDDAQGKLWLQKKAQTLRERIARRQAEKEEHVGASHQRTADRQNLCETLQSNEAETERLARSLKELQNRSEEIRARQIELDEADRTGVGATLEIDRMITRDEHDLKILSDAANL